MAIKSKNRVSTEFSASSMTDIVFLLLIFFMLTSQIVTPLGVKVNLPTSKVSSIQMQKITVAISENLEYSLNGKVIVAHEVEEELRQVLIATPEEERLVILSVDKKVPMEHFVKVAGIAASLKAQVTIATKADE